MSVRGFSDGWGIVAHEQVSVKRATAEEGKR
jgi:hypothetical protein